MADPRIIELRKRLRRKFPAAHAKSTLFQPTADTPSLRSPAPLSPASFPPGAISEIVAGTPSCGLSLVLAALLEAMPSENPDSSFGSHPSPLVLIDARDRFDPDCFPAAQCARLLWVRCRETPHALEAADLLVRDANLPRIVLDLAALPERELRRIRRPVWHRFRQLAAERGPALIVLSPAPTVPCAALRLTLASRFTLDHLTLSRPHALLRLHSATDILRRAAGT